MQPFEALQAKRYLEPAEITAHLMGVEYVIMAAPAPDKFTDSPIHFSIFLNTQDILPQPIKESVLQKFCEQYNINNVTEVMSCRQPVGFAKTTMETPMPMLLIKPQDQATIPHTPMHVIDFLGNSPDFKETTEQSLTGWSYSYND